MPGPEADVGRLTDTNYWDAKYGAGAGNSTGEPPIPRRTALAKRLLGHGIADWTEDYSDYLLWETVYRLHMPRGPGVKVLEVGSAPGDHLVRLHRTFALEPYGVEFSERGVLVNRERFAKQGLNCENVIQADFFSPDFHRKYAGAFDVVVSRGFIEHFTDVHAVLAKHVGLLRSGGHLFVTIPNLRGIYRALTWFFNREALSRHNLEIMRLSSFRHLFTGHRVSPVLCGYYGTFTFGIVGTSDGAVVRRWLFLGCAALQQVLNPLFHLMFGARGAENPFTSPYLIFVGVKRD